MGIDWVRMRVRDGVAPAELKDLADVQAKLARSVLCHAEPSADDRRRYGAAWDGLTARLHVAGFDSWDGDTDWTEFPPSWRFNALGTHPLFPQEWQATALRTWLPAELPDHVRTWRDYLSAVRAGRYRHYLFAKYLHDQSTELLAEWRLMAGFAAETATRTSAWAAKPGLVAVRTRLTSLREPAVTSPAPAWPTDDADGDVDPDQDPAYRALREADARRIQLARELDAALPGRWQRRRYQPIPTFAEYLAEADDDWCTGLLDWLTRVSAHGQGVLLW